MTLILMIVVVDNYDDDDDYSKLNNMTNFFHQHLQVAVSDQPAPNGDAERFGVFLLDLWQCPGSVGSLSEIQRNL